MLAQIGQWIELNFWQLAVHALSKARPLSSRAFGAAHSITTQHSFEVRPLAHAIAQMPAIGRRLSSPYAIAISGWLLGLILGLWFSSW